MKNLKKIRNQPLSRTLFGRKASRRSTLRFSPTAWAKLLYLREAGESEIGGFGISAADDPAIVEDVKLIRQSCTTVSVVFDDRAVADFFDEQVDLGLSPARFARIWVHTHPGECPLPSATDEETFSRVFDRPDWAIMFILAGGEQTYARVRYNVGPQTTAMLPVVVDYARPFAACDAAAWRKEYEANVSILQPQHFADDGERLAPDGGYELYRVREDDRCNPVFGAEFEEFHQRFAYEAGR